MRWYLKVIVNSLSKAGTTRINTTVHPRGVSSLKCQIKMTLRNDKDQIFLFFRESLFVMHSICITLIPLVPKIVFA